MFPDLSQWGLEPGQQLASIVKQKDTQNQTLPGQSYSQEGKNVWMYNAILILHNKFNFLEQVPSQSDLNLPLKKYRVLMEDYTSAVLIIMLENQSSRKYHYKFFVSKWNTQNLLVFNIYREMWETLKVTQPQYLFYFIHLCFCQFTTLRVLCFL